MNARSGRLSADPTTAAGPAALRLGAAARRTRQQHPRPRLRGGRRPTGGRTRRAAGTTAGRRHRLPADRVRCSSSAYVHTHRGAPEAQIGARRAGRQRCASAEDRGDDLSAQLAAAERASSRPRATARCRPASEPSCPRPSSRPARWRSPGPGSASPSTSRHRQPRRRRAGRGGTTPVSAAHILTDRDVRSVVNELWARRRRGDLGERRPAHADVGDPLRRRGGAGRLPGHQPAVHDPGDRRRRHLATGFAMSEVASRYQTLSSAVGIRFAFDEKDSLTLPASIRPRCATPGRSPPSRRRPAPDRRTPSDRRACAAGGRHRRRAAAAPHRAGLARALPADRGRRGPGRGLRRRPGAAGRHLRRQGLRRLLRLQRGRSPR